MASTVAPLCLTETPLAAGDQWVLEASLPEYAAADGYTATLHLVGPSVLRVTGVADGTTWTFTAGSADTANLTAGRYVAAVQVVLDDEATTLSAVAITVTPNIATASADAFLTHEERAIPLLEAAILRRVTVDLKAYTIQTRQATKEELLDMQRLLDRYRATVLRRDGGGRLPSVAVRFGRGG